MVLEAVEEERVGLLLKPKSIFHGPGRPPPVQIVTLATAGGADRHGADRHGAAPINLILSIS